MKFYPKKSLGQNFLNDEKIIKQIAELGNINNKDLILEVGPGTGKLTEKILEKKPLRLTVIEKDERLASFLHNKFGNRINMINDDVMDYSFSDHGNENLKIFNAATNFSYRDDIPFDLVFDSACERRRYGQGKKSF